MPSTPRVSFEPIDYPTDHRGLVLEPLRAEEFASQRNAHLVLTAPGCVRGNHYHREGTEICVVIGPALVRYRDTDERGASSVVEHVLSPGQAVRYVFPPGIAHAMRNIGESPLVIISFNTEEHHRDRPDVARDVLIEV